jgi:serine/threonine protein kinase
MICNPIADMTRTTRDVRKLARILSKVDPLTFGLLACRGVVKTSTEDPSPIGQGINSFKFVFSIPPSLKSPRSLRTLLIENDASFTLNSRFDLAKQLTNSVLFVHNSQFVHKNIRPETIIVFENDSAKIGSSFLVGFEKFRPAEGMTYRISDGIWQHDLCRPLSHSLFLSRFAFPLPQEIYCHKRCMVLTTDVQTPDRHPNRQGTQPEEDYQMQHDIYSLGVVLLELGLWQSFISFPPESDDPNTALPPPFLQALESEKDTRKRATGVKGALTTLATELLPARMGQKYTDVVLLCLQCLDGAPGSLVAGAEGEKWGEKAGAGAGTGVGWGEEEGIVDEDGIVVGVRYIERVLLRMQEISI